MMHALVTLAALLSGACSMPTRSVKLPYSSVVAFGDSFTDNGNGSYRISNKTWPANPAYYRGRFSNGPVWVEDVAANLSLPLYDFAVGGATSSNRLTQGFTGPGSVIPVPSVDEQVQNFLSRPTTSVPDALYVVFAGANDPLFNPNITAAQSFQYITASVQQLRRQGACHFLLLNYPDLSQIPYDYYIDALSKVQLHDYSTQLGTLLQAFASQNSNVTYVDLVPLFNRFGYYGAPESYGFSKYGDYGSCLTGVYRETSNVTLCSDAFQFVFWDEYHPTSHSHQLIAQQVLNAVRGPLN